MEQTDLRGSILLDGRPLPVALLTNHTAAGRVRARFEDGTQAEVQRVRTGWRVNLTSGTERRMRVA